jgi:hypothetical protein
VKRGSNFIELMSLALRVAFRGSGVDLSFGDFLSQTCELPFAVGDFVQCGGRPLKRLAFALQITLCSSRILSRLLPGTGARLLINVVFMPSDLSLAQRPRGDCVAPSRATGIDQQTSSQLLPLFATGAALGVPVLPSGSGAPPVEKRDDAAVETGFTVPCPLPRLSWPLVKLTG